MEKDPPVLKLSYSVGEHQMHQKGADVQKDHYREIIFDIFITSLLKLELPIAEALTRYRLTNQIVAALL